MLPTCVDIPTIHILPFLTHPFQDLKSPQANEMNQVCLCRKILKMCTVGVPPGTVLGNTALKNILGSIQVKLDSICGVMLIPPPPQKIYFSLVFLNEKDKQNKV